ncbi:MAG TPA: tRNA (N6-isopentenyl adenosine(37)-C2)-methylthiotransferase MiaB [Candidatus Acidoferrales bacterium]|nr:tRNA (N6-isopentenyl adenosine(37)-C2)-methylthiotransferase MiaB [Candidatus Acidoferrales bacterium]
MNSHDDRKSRELKVYIETYGCQMNLADSEIVLGIMNKWGYSPTKSIDDADVVLLNTCSVRNHAEEKIHQRLHVIMKRKSENSDLLVGVLGCMAERLRKSLLEKHNVDIVVGPDDYRKLPQLLEGAFAGVRGIGVQLSRTETYDDIVPLRTEGISAWISIMRGCDKFCTFCIVPFTRGRERSRTLGSVVREVEQLVDQGFREITLLGQNVNSYRDNTNDFSDLLAAVANVDRRLRVRFTTSHPQDLSDKLIDTIASHDNLCKYIHLPVQSGSNRILEAMNRTYARQQYVELVNKIRERIPGVALSTDIISGFPTETEDEHRETMRLMEELRYDGAYMFKYSPREGTPAYRLGDDVAEETKTRRLNEIIALQQRVSYEINQSEIGKVFEVMVDGVSKKSDLQQSGRTDTNKTVVFPLCLLKPGDVAEVRINRASAATLFGEVVSNLN